MGRGKIVLMPWDEPAARRRAGPSGADGGDVAPEAEDGGRAYRLIRAEPPEVIAAGPARRPSHRREAGRSLRLAWATRGLPPIFADGDAPAREPVAAQIAGAVSATSAESGAVPARSSRPGDEETPA